MPKFTDAMDLKSTTGCPCHDSQNKNVKENDVCYKYVSDIHYKLFCKTVSNTLLWLNMYWKEL